MSQKIVFHDPYVWMFPLISVFSHPRGLYVVQNSAKITEFADYFGNWWCCSERSLNANSVNLWLGQRNWERSLPFFWNMTVHACDGRAEITQKFSKRRLALLQWLEGHGPMPAPFIC